jgi:predicted Fe-S protein YdhL (DUF1289 family)
VRLRGIDSHPVQSMFGAPTPPPLPVRSPCIGTCRLDNRGQCQGCHRTLGEIAAWMTMEPRERDHLMDVVLPARGRGERPA